MASTYTAEDTGKNSQIITPVTGSVVTITLTDDDWQLVHLNVQNDGSTASAATDYVVVMNQQTPAGAAVTMAATYADGGNGKLIIGANLARDFSGKYIPAGSDGPHEIQIQAVGHGCKMALIRKHYPN